MGILRKNTLYRTGGRSLGFYAGIILCGAIILALLSFAPQNIMIFGWGFILVAAAATYLLLSALPQRKTTAGIVAASLAGAIISSCYTASQGSLAENAIWLFLALIAVLAAQIVSNADLSVRLDAIIHAVALLVATHMGVLWLLAPRDITLTSYSGRVAVVVAAGALVLLFPLTQVVRISVVIFITTAGFAVIAYTARGMTLLDAVCIGFTCGLLILSGSRYVALLTVRKRAEHYDDALTRKRLNIRVQLLSGAATILCIGVVSYFLGTIFVL